MFASTLASFVASGLLCSIVRSLRGYALTPWKVGRQFWHWQLRNALWLPDFGAWTDTWGRYKITLMLLSIGFSIALLAMCLAYRVLLSHVEPMNVAMSRKFKVKVARIAHKKTALISGGLAGGIAGLLAALRHYGQVIIPDESACIVMSGSLSIIGPSLFVWTFWRLTTRLLAKRGNNCTCGYPLINDKCPECGQVGKRAVRLRFSCHPTTTNGRCSTYS